MPLISILKTLKVYWLPILWMGVIFVLSSIRSYGVEINLPGADKIAHFWEYGILGFLWLRSWMKGGWPVVEKGRHSAPRRTYWWQIALLVGLIYGISDEIHQLFVPGRDFDLRDWAMDIFSAWAGGWFYVRFVMDTRPRLLLHMCCANCGALVVERLKSAYRLEVMFYNPNITPAREYQKRLADVEKLCRAQGLNLIHNARAKKSSFWRGCLPKILKAPEGGARCKFCFEKRLEETARQAKAGGYDFWATTLTVGPRKNAKVINSIGQQLAKKYGIMFYADDFKQKGGFARSVALSKEAGFYRQKYCGCRFSR